MGVVRRRRTLKWTRPRTVVSPVEWLSAWECLWLCGLGGLTLVLTVYWGIEQEITMPWVEEGEWRTRGLLQARRHAIVFSTGIGLMLASGVWLFIQGLLSLSQYRTLRRQRFWRRHHRYRLQPNPRHPASADFADTQPWAYAIPPEFADTVPLAYSAEAQERWGTEATATLVLTR